MGGREAQQQETLSTGSDGKGILPP